jgi:WD40 repeat protein
MPVMSFAVSPDGKNALIQSMVGVTAWSIERGEKLGWPAHIDLRGPGSMMLDASEPVTLRSLNLGSNLAALGLSNGDLLFLAAGDGREIARIQKAHDGPIAGVCAFDNIIVSASEDGVIKSWVGTDITPHSTLTGVGKIQGFTGHRGRRLVAVRTDDTSLPVISVGPAGKLSIKRKFTGLSDKPSSVAFGGNGQWIVAGGSDGYVAVWDAESGSMTGDLDLCPGWRTFHWWLGAFRWFIPRSKQLDLMADALITGEDELVDQTLMGEKITRKIEYLPPILSGLLFIFVGVNLTALIFSARDL